MIRKHFNAGIGCSKIKQDIIFLYRMSALGLELNITGCLHMLQVSCNKYFHLPCVLASGGFMDFQSKSSFCKDHLYQAPLTSK